MNTLWHFGDSWGTCDEKEEIFSTYIAQHFGLKLQYRCRGGLSNYRILQRMLRELDKFGDNDIILVNWSYQSRMDAFQIHPHTKKPHILPSCGEDLDECVEITPHIQWMIDGALNYGKEEFYKFSMIAKDFLDSLTRKGMTIFNVFLNPVLPWQPKFPTYTIQFDNVGSYDNWCQKKGWGKEQSTHYTWGIQKDLSKYYIDHMTKLHPSLTTTTDRPII
jgi:hypothetical protein